MANPVCKECGGKGYTNAVMRLDGGATYTVCPCTGITADSIKTLADDIVENGPAIYESQHVTSEGDK